jgi:hypothetical protein
MENIKQFTFFILMTLLFTWQLKAQNNSKNIYQNLRGCIRDQNTGLFLEQVSVEIISALPNVNKTTFSQQTTSDSSGIFRFTKLPLGSYKITLSLLGYETKIFENWRLETGKESILNISLQETHAELPTVTVEAQQVRRAENEFFPALEVLERDRLQMPATFGDPARFAAYAPGMSAENDGANNIAVRGLAPSTTQWFVEGAEVLNPNHLGNAGNPSDLSSGQGGGVMILSSNMLASATLFQGLAPASYNHAIGGVFDLKLREGNAEKRQSSVSLSTIGLDVHTEGYFSKKIKASYLLNYRYSTIGLLSKLGVDFSDEKILFQDLNAHFNFQTARMGVFSAFTIFGKNSNRRALKPYKEWQEVRDSQEINFDAQTGIIGIKHHFRTPKRLYETVMAYSVLNDEYDQMLYFSADTTGQNIRKEGYSNNQIFNQSKWYLRSQMTHFLKKKSWLKFGVVAKTDDFRVRLTEKKRLGVAGLDRYDTINLRPFFLQFFGIWHKNLTKNLSFELGARLIGTPYFVEFPSGAFLEPSATIVYRTNNNAHFQFAYAQQSQTGTISREIDYNKTRSHAFSTKFSKTFKKNIHLELEGFAIFLKTYGETQIISTSQLDPSPVRNNPFYVERTLKPLYMQPARSYGISVAVQQKLTSGWYWSSNATLFEAEIKYAPNLWRNLRNNNRYIVNGLVGKEWSFSGTKTQLLGFSVRLVQRGGVWANPKPIDQVINFNWGEPNSEQLPTYFRADLNLYLKRNHRHYSSTLQLDIQNISNRENIQYRYYNVKLPKNTETVMLNKATPQAVQVFKQLGLIPNLVYKIEF